MDHGREKKRVNTVARALLAGMHLKSNASSPLQLLRSCPHLLERIYTDTRSAWISTLKAALAEANNGNTEYEDLQLCTQFSCGRPAFRLVANLTTTYLTSNAKFPLPTGLSCNMIPFVCSTQGCSLPSKYHGYLPMIMRCARLLRAELGKVWYLTVYESPHDAAPKQQHVIHTDGILLKPATCLQRHVWHHSGFSVSGSFSGGIFYASNVSDSRKIWDVEIPRPPDDALGHGCDLNHLRDVLDEFVPSIRTKANHLYWMTDATPHEMLPLPARMKRQFFRLVTGQPRAWSEGGSTCNSLGVEPNCPIIIRDSFPE